jgi:hypothetical protein
VCFSAIHYRGAVFSTIVAASQFSGHHFAVAQIDSFLGDYYGYRCHSGKKSSDIFNDYLDLLDGVLAYDESEINWQLANDATAKEFESWERLMLQGFYRCATYNHNMNNCTCLALAD